MKTSIYTLLVCVSILATITLVQCGKENDLVPVTNEAEIKLIDSMQVETRAGDVYPIAYIETNSSTFHEEKTQFAINQDSLLRTRYIRITGPNARYTKKLGTLDPSWSNKPARLYTVIYTLKNNTVIELKSVWSKDTTATDFTIPASSTTNLFPGKYIKFSTVRLDQQPVYYYDTDYKKTKYQYYYTSSMDTISYTNDIPANSTGTIYWFNHKM